VFEASMRFLPPVMMAKQPKSTETQEHNKRGNAIREEEKKIR